MKIRVTVNVRMYATVEIDDTLAIPYIREDDKDLTETQYSELADKFNDALSKALPPIAVGWDDYDVDDEVYDEVK